MVSTQCSLNFELNARGFESEREKYLLANKGINWIGKVIQGLEMSVNLVFPTEILEANSARI